MDEWDALRKRLNSALCTSCSVPAHTRLGPRPASRRRLKTLGGSTTAVSLADATPGPALAVDSVSPRLGGCE